MITINKVKQKLSELQIEEFYTELFYVDANQ